MLALIETRNNAWKFAIGFLVCWCGPGACTPAFENCGDTRSCGSDGTHHPDASAGGGAAGSSGMGQGGHAASGGASGNAGASGSAGLQSGGAGGNAGASGESGAGNAAGEHGDASADA